MLTSLVLLTLVLVALQVLGHRVATGGARRPSPHMRRVLAVSLLATAAFSATSALALRSDRFLHADSWIEARLAPIDSGRTTTNPPLNSFVQHIANHDGGYYAVIGVTLVVLEGVRRRWATLGLATVALAGGFVLVEVAKRLLDRTRPPAYDSVGLGPIWETPSGHTFIATVVAGLVYVLWAAERSRRARVIAAVALAAFVVAVGMVRLLSGTHYPSDTVAGLGLGIAWLGMCTMYFAQTSSERESE